MARPQLPRQPEAPSRPESGGRFARLLTTARALRREPSGALNLVRELLVRVWQRRGGGFYGLGYIVAFLVLEAQLLAGDLADSASTSEFVVAQLLEWLFRFGVMSFLVALKALLWPLYVLDLLGGIGIIALAIGYFGFERLIRPAVERMLPELREHREDRERPARARRRSVDTGQTENENPPSPEHSP